MKVNQSIRHVISLSIVGVLLILAAGSTEKGSSTSAPKTQDEIAPKTQDEIRKEQIEKQFIENRK